MNRQVPTEGRPTVEVHYFSTVSKLIRCAFPVGFLRVITIIFTGNLNHHEREVYPKDFQESLHSLVPY